MGGLHLNDKGIDKLFDNIFGTIQLRCSHNCRDNAKFVSFPSGCKLHVITEPTRRNSFYS